MKYIITPKQYKLLKEEEQEILYIPSVDLFGGWENLQEFLKRRGNPPYLIGGDLDFRGTSIQYLGNLRYVGGNLDLFKTQIKSLGNLTSVGGNLDLRYTSLAEKYSAKQIRKMVSVGRDILL